MVIAPYEMLLFEQIKKGEVASSHFAFSNAGNAPLEIELVSACECIEATWPADPVAPGEQAQIEIRFNTAHEPPGEALKNVDVIFKNVDENGYPLVRQFYVKALVVE